MSRSRRDAEALDAASHVRGGGTYKRTQCYACPERFGSPDRRGSWALNTDNGWYMCWRCGLRGRLPGYEDHDDLYEVESEQDFEVIEEENPLVAEGYIPVTEPDTALARARRYLKKRGLSYRTVTEARIGAAVEGPLKGRVIVPVFDTDGETWLGWSARLYRKPRVFNFDGVEVKESKYRNASGMARGAALYNRAVLLTAGPEPVICVEGVFDALPYWPYCTALLGKVADEQIELLLASKRDLIIAIDGDSWGEAEALAMRLQFDGFNRNVGWLRLPPTRDPANVQKWVRAEIEKMRESWKA